MEVIASLREKISRIIEYNKKLSSEVSRLTTEYDQLTLQKREADMRIKELEERMDILETARSFQTVSGGERAARLRINRLLREIDSCIALMNR